MKPFSKCFITVFAGIALGLLEGLIETKICVSPPFEYVLVINSPPTEQFYSALPFLPLSVRSRSECNRLNRSMTTASGNYSEWYFYIESHVLNNLFRLFIQSPRRVLHNATRITNSDIVCWRISQVLNRQLEVIRLVITNLSDNIGSISVNGALFRSQNSDFGLLKLSLESSLIQGHLLFEGFQLTFHDFRLCLSGFSLGSQMPFLFVNGLKLTLHYFGLFSYYPPRSEHGARLSLNDLQLLASAFGLFLNLPPLHSGESGINKKDGGCNDAGNNQDPILFNLRLLKRFSYAILFGLLALTCCVGFVVGFNLALIQGSWRDAGSGALWLALGFLFCWLCVRTLQQKSPYNKVFPHDANCNTKCLDTSEKL
jgi:hypothetical protein